MYCATCDRHEHSDLGLDTETCMKCGGYLCQSDDDEDSTHESEPQQGDGMTDSTEADIVKLAAAVEDTHKAFIRSVTGTRKEYEGARRAYEQAMRAHHDALGYGAPTVMATEGKTNG